MSRIRSAALWIAWLAFVAVYFGGLFWLDRQFGSMLPREARFELHTGYGVGVWSLIFLRGELTGLRGDDPDLESPSLRMLRTLWNAGRPRSREDLLLARLGTRLLGLTMLVMGVDAIYRLDDGTIGFLVGAGASAMMIVSLAIALILGARASDQTARLVAKLRSRSTPSPAP